MPDNVRRRHRAARAKLKRFTRVSLDQAWTWLELLRALVARAAKESGANWLGLLFYEWGFRAQLRDPEPPTRRGVDGHALVGSQGGSAASSGVGAALGGGCDEAEGRD